MKFTLNKPAQRSARAAKLARFKQTAHPVRVRHVAALLLALAFGWFGAFAQSGNTFEGRLSKVPVDAKAVPIIIGTGHAKGTLQGAKLTVTGTFEGLGTNATIAQLRMSQYPGMRGNVIGELTVTKADKGTVGGTIDLKPDQVEGLKKGRVYVQIHSEKGPEGHLWGWLLP